MEQNENRTIKKEQEQNDLAVDPRSRTERNNFKKSEHVQAYLRIFMHIRNNGDFHRNKHFSNQKNDVIFHNIDQNNGFRATL